MREIVDSASPHVIPEAKPIPAEWRITGLIVFATILCVVGIFWPTVRSMTIAWSGSRTYAHGFLVLPAAGYLIWCHRQKLMSLMPEPNIWGAAALGLTANVWVVGYLADLVWLEQAAVVASLPGLVWALLGTKIVRTLSWPLGFLVFMLPVGTSIEPWLQDFTVWFILKGLQFADIPYLDEGYRITIPSGTWEVAPDCGGLRYLLPGLALGYAFATLIYRQPARRIVALAVCALMLMVANGVRAYGIILGDHLGIARGADHRVFSYTIYGFTILLLFWCGLRWSDSKPAIPCHEPGEDVGYGHPTGKTAVMAIAVVALLAVAPMSMWLWGSHP